MRKGSAVRIGMWNSAYPDRGTAIANTVYGPMVASGVSRSGGCSGRSGGRLSRCVRVYRLRTNKRKRCIKRRHRARR